jgi:hypothetical protein
MLAFLSII